MNDSGPIRETLPTVAGITGDLVKPRNPCVCGSKSGWRLCELRVFPGDGEPDERQRTAWACDKCNVVVVCSFEPGPGGVANTSHPEAT